MSINGYDSDPVAGPCLPEYLSPVIGDNITSSTLISPHSSVTPDQRIHSDHSQGNTARHSIILVYTVILFM